MDKFELVRVLHQSNAIYVCCFYYYSFDFKYLIAYP